MSRMTDTAPPAPQNGATMLDRTNRTFICSVLFLDIVEYSRKPVSEQILLKERFNALIADAIRDIAPNDRIILDTGDGVAINFLGDPEDALFVAMNLREAFKRPLAGGLTLEARVGINLGPVRLVKDLNGQPNIIGDGINVAQRVMSFSDRGQVLVSRSYFEVVSHISDGYAQLFAYRGSRTDKHVREHEIYEVGARPPGAAAEQSGQFRTLNEGTSIPAPPTPPAPPAPASEAPTAGPVPWWRNARAAYVATLMSVMALACAVVLSERRHESPPAATLAAPAPAPAPTKLAVAAPDKPVARKMVDLDELLLLPPADQHAGGYKDPHPGRKRVAVADMGDGRLGTLPEPALAAPAPSASGSAQGNPAIAEKAVIAFAVSPWGEIYVNGAKLGVSPPVNVVEVGPGKIEVEIRNPGFPTYTETVDVASGQHVRIKHKF
ncbi:MAG: PEGA domain-containing protein [Betaproteobacteria bacterium]